MPPPAVGCFINFEMKQLMAGGGIILLGTTLIPLLSGLNVAVFSYFSRIILCLSALSLKLKWISTVWRTVSPSMSSWMTIF